MKRLRLFFLLFVVPITVGCLLAVWQSGPVETVVETCCSIGDRLMAQVSSQLDRLRRL
jgi:hypothetical protein